MLRNVNVSRIRIYRVSYKRPKSDDCYRGDGLSPMNSPSTCLYSLLSKLKKELDRMNSSIYCWCVRSPIILAFFMVLITNLLSCDSLSSVSWLAVSGVRIKGIWNGDLYRDFVGSIVSSVFSLFSWFLSCTAHQAKSTFTLSMKVLSTLGFKAKLGPKTRRDISFSEISGTLITVTRSLGSSVIIPEWTGVGRL